ncbi:MAG: hypothetical protein ACREPM_07775 [Gemmatimonadaceae bacterium]
MRAAIATLAMMANRSGIPHERLLVDLKEMVVKLPHFQERPVPARDDMMRDLVTLTIESYYARKAD